MLKGYDPEKLERFTNKSLLEFKAPNISVSEALYDHKKVFLYQIVLENPKQLKTPDFFLRNLNTFIHIPIHPCIQQFYGYNLNECDFIAARVPHILYTHLQDDPNEGKPKPGVSNSNLRTVRTKSPKDKDSLAELYHNLNTFSNTSKSIFVYALACALLHLHAHGITHRNLNPRSIAVSDDNLPIITSFFQANIAKDAAAKLQMTLVTADETIFAAPEILKAEIEVQNFNSKVDVYSYAMILQAFATNRFPYLEGYDFQLKKREKPTRFARQNFPIPFSKRIIAGIRPTLNEEEGLENLNTLIQKCWDPDPDARPSFSDIIIYLDKCGPLFPNTDMKAYEKAKSEIFARTDIPENDIKCFSDRSREVFHSLECKLEKKSITNSEKFQLAKMLKDGDGCIKNPQKAIEIFTDLSNEGDNHSKLELAIINSQMIQKKGNISYASKADQFFQELLSAKFYKGYLPYCEFLTNYYHLLNKSLSDSAEQISNISKELIQYYSQLLNTNSNNSNEINISKEKGKAELELAKALITLADSKFSNDKAKYDFTLKQAEDLLKVSRENCISSNSVLVNLLLKLERNEEAIEIVSKAVEDHPCASIYLTYGEMFEEGIITGESYEFEALKAYEKAIIYGSIVARRKAAMIYENLDEVFTSDYQQISENPDLERAAQLYEEAANMGDVISQNKFGLMLLEGKGIQKSAYCALTYFEEASKPTVYPPMIESMVNTAEIYYNGCSQEKLNRNKQVAKKYLDMAINNSKLVPSLDPQLVERAQKLLSNYQ